MARVLMRVRGAYVATVWSDLAYGFENLRAWEIGLQGEDLRQKTTAYVEEPQSPK